MRITTLGYHDVVQPGNDSGAMVRSAAGFYTLTREQFRLHLQAVQAVPVRVAVVQNAFVENQQTVLFTFDDGAIGGYRYAADELERMGWRGHFFITTDWISKPGFMEPKHLRDLHRRGHVIGSHTCSHPARMSSLSAEQLQHEWSSSRTILENILGAPVNVASVSDGYYSKRVGLSAHSSRIHFLFNSEPTDRLQKVAECHVLGRFPLFASSPPSLAAAYAAGEFLPRLKQSATWKLKRVLKALGGQTYLNLRHSVLSRSLTR